MTEAENFNRLIRLIARGGTATVRELLNKYSAPLKFIDFLYNNQGLLQKLKLSDNETHVLAGRDLEKMDLTLLCKLALNIYKDKMTSVEKINLMKVKQERDEFLHSEILKSGKVDEQFFKRKWQYISSLLKDLAQEIGGTQFQAEVQIIIVDTEHSSPTFLEVYETLLGWCESNKELTKKVEQLHAAFEELKEKQSKLCRKAMTRQDALMDKFQSHYKYNNKEEIELTRKMETALEYLYHSHSVVLFGRPGEGKTVAAFRLVKSLIKDGKISLDRCVILSEPDDLKDIRSDDLDLILIDDMFGRHNKEADKLLGWRNHFQTLQALVGNREVRLIIVSRKHIYLECKKEIDDVELFKRAVELSSKELSTIEKKHILLSHLVNNSRNTADVNIDKCISQQESDVGFPLCAQQFASESTLFKKGEEYFGSSYKLSLMKNVNNLDPLSTIALLYVFYKENNLKGPELDITAIDDVSEDVLSHIARLCGVATPFVSLLKEVKSKINHLTDTYVKCINKTYSFLHSTMYEAIAFIHAKEYPAEVINHCTLDFLCQCIRVEEESSEDGITVDEDTFEVLISRCVKDVVENKNIKRLSKHPVFKNPSFVEKFFAVVSEDNLKAFFSAGLSFMYFGMHGFLYHTIADEIERLDFLERSMQILKCKHSEEANTSCWRCSVKAEALAAACAVNQEQMYRTLRHAGANVSSFCLYKASENRSSPLQFIRLITEDMKKANLLSENDQTLQFALGMIMKHDDKGALNLMKDAGLKPTNQFLYYVVKEGDEELLNITIEELKKDKRLLTEFQVSRALLEAHVRQDSKAITILKSAGIVFTEATIYWALVDHGYDEIKFVVSYLKEHDLLDTESTCLSWGVAMAMKHEDKRIYELLKAEGCVVSTPSLLWAITELGQTADEIQKVIVDLKNLGRWDPEHRDITCAYMVARRNSDKTVKDMLEKENVGISSGCLIYTLLRFDDELEYILDRLHEKRKFDPYDECLARALVYSIQYNDKTLTERLKGEGIDFNMTCLISVAEPRFYLLTLETVISEIKTNKKWDINSDAALQALNVAVKRHDKSIHQRLVDEGLEWKTRNLYVAVQQGTVWGLKHVIKQMRRLQLLDPSDDEIKSAVLLAKSLKDTRVIGILEADTIIV